MGKVNIVAYQAWVWLCTNCHRENVVEDKPDYHGEQAECRHCDFKVTIAPISDEAAERQATVRQQRKAKSPRSCETCFGMVNSVYCGKRVCRGYSRWKRVPSAVV